MWCTATGQVLCCNRGFTDLFGFRSLDLVGRNIKVVASNPDDMEAHIIEASDRSKLQNDEEDADDISKARSIPNTKGIPPIRSSALHCCCALVNV